MTDLLGSVLASFTNVASSATLKCNQVFGPYGSARYSQGSLNTAKGFTGQYNDALTGLDYYGARYYDPAVGVFLSADSVQGNAQGMNPYAYVGGNPETRTDPTGRVVVGLGGQRYYPPVVASAPDPCTLTSCSVTLTDPYGKKTFTLSDLRTNVTLRIGFLTDFYNMFARGYGQAETDFFKYLLSSGRLDDPNGYWNVVDFQLIRDQLVAAYDFQSHHFAQSLLVSNWLAFMMHPGNNNWWTAHNGSINASDQQARSSGLYGKQSAIQQIFIDETIHLINGIQGLSSNIDFVSSLFGPRARTTGTLASIFYPFQDNDFVTAGYLLGQGFFVAGLGAGAVGAGVGALVGGGPVGAGVGFIIGASIGLIVYYGFVL